MRKLGKIFLGKKCWEAVQRALVQIIYFHWKQSCTKCVYKQKAYGTQNQQQSPWFPITGFQYRYWFLAGLIRNDGPNRFFKLFKLQTLQKVSRLGFHHKYKNRFSFAWICETVEKAFRSRWPSSWPRPRSRVLVSTTHTRHGVGVGFMIFERNASCCRLDSRRCGC